MHCFADVPLGLTARDAPVQCFPLPNNTDWPLEYHIDDKGLEESRETNEGVRVFTCLNPRGTVPARSVGYLRWKVQPLQAKTYRLHVPIHVEGSQLPPQVILFLCAGFSLRERAVQGHLVLDQQSLLEASSFPKVQTLVLQGQNVQLTDETVRL